MKDSEFLVEVKAKLELEALGYKLIKCHLCNGTGVREGINDSRFPCGHCDTRGHIWKAP